MNVTFIRPSDNSERTVNITDSSYVNLNIMGDQTAMVEFYSTWPTSIQRGDRVTLLGAHYFVKDTPMPVRELNRYKYQLTLNGTQYELEKAIYFISDSTGIDNTTKGAYTCTPAEFLAQLIVNLKRLQPSVNWIAGDALSADAKTVELNDNNCLDALKSAAEIFDTHWRVEGHRVSLDAISSASRPFTLEVGKGKGLRDITANKSNDSQVVTRLFPYGSDKNSPLGQRLTIPPVDQYGADELIEGVHVFDDIFPEIRLTVTAIMHSGQYNYVLRTADPGFDLDDYIQPGVTPQITFLTGELSGMTFDILWEDYQGQNVYILIPYTLPGNITVPGSQGYEPAVGDIFELWNITMPDVFIEAAESDLYAAAMEWLADHQEKVKLNVATDDNYFKANGIEVPLYSRVRLISDNIPGLYSPGRLCEVLGFKRRINKPWIYDTLTVGDVVLKPGLPPAIVNVIQQTVYKNTIINEGGTDATYQHVQLHALTEWTVRHNLNKYPSVSVTDASGAEIEGVVTWLTPNTLKINFSVAVAGKATCN